MLTEGGSEEDEPINWLEWIPLIICLLIFLGVVIYICADYSGAMKILSDICDYVKDHPYESIAILISFYMVLVLLILPITVLHLMVAFAYCKVYNDFWLGFLMATWIIFTGCLIGAIIALYLGRVLFADYIRRQLDKSKSLRVKKWRIVDGMFVTDGILLVSLLRLMFIPFGLTSYLLGVTSVSFWDYLIGSLVYLIKIALIVIVGCTIWEASEEA
jgi:uncharacterized membrane protein YdjX (TVP38/TMEM64 family)